jgi:hypothetical protein
VIRATDFAETELAKLSDDAKTAIPKSLAYPIAAARHRQQRDLPDANGSGAETPVVKLTFPKYDETPKYAPNWMARSQAREAAANQAH